MIPRMMVRNSWIPCCVAGCGLAAYGLAYESYYLQLFALAFLGLAAILNLLTKRQTR